MKSLKANNYEKAVLELNEFDRDLGNQISEEIKPQDAGHFHVALVRVTDKPGAPKNDVSVQVQHYNEQGFEKLDKNFMYQNINKIVVVHDPRKNVAEAKKTTEGATGTSTENKTMSQAEMDAEIERQANERFEQYKNSLKQEGNDFVDSVKTPVIQTPGITASADALAETGSPKIEKTEGELRFENLITEGTADQLKAYAKEKEIDLTGNLTNKGTILGAVKAWGEDPENVK